MTLTPEQRDWIYYRLNDGLATATGKPTGRIYDYIFFSGVDFTVALFIVNVFEDWYKEKGTIPDREVLSQVCAAFHHWWKQWDSEEEAEKQYRELKIAGVPTEDIFSI